jgi:hypothetical protein
MKGQIRYTTMRGKRRIWKPGRDKLCEICPNMTGREMQRIGGKTVLRYNCRFQEWGTVEGKHVCKNFNKSIEDFFG